MPDPFQAVKDFERALCDYTGASYAVATTSCTMALLLALLYKRQTISGTFVSQYGNTIVIPRRTYVGVGMSVINSGYKVAFRDEDWSGSYQLWPYDIWDCARRFTSGMYVPGQMQCLSFHWSKILGIGQGGAILHDDLGADAWLRRARFDGRTEGVTASEDVPRHLGYHAYMMPRDAAEGLTRLSLLPKENDDLPNSNYPDLSKIRLFQ